MRFHAYLLFEWITAVARGRSENSSTDLLQRVLAPGKHERKRAEGHQRPRPRFRGGGGNTDIGNVGKIRGGEIGVECSWEAEEIHLHDRGWTVEGLKVPRQERKL